MVVCRRCGGNHWTLSCPLKDLQQPTAGTGGATPNLTGGASSPSASNPNTNASGTTSGGKYVPPSQRNSGSDTNKGETPLEELTQLRVSNLSDEVDDDDLKMLFTPFGRIDKIHLAIDHETKRSRGFAFVRYLSHAHAEAAMKALDGLPFKHLVLRVEWSRSDRQRNSGGGQINAAHYSGYGKKLAQDVVRK